MRFFVLPIFGGVVMDGHPIFQNTGWLNITRKFRLRTDALRDTQSSRALNTQPPRVIAERAIHHVVVMDEQSFGQDQWKFLLTCLTTPTN